MSVCTSCPAGRVGTLTAQKTSAAGCPSECHFTILHKFSFTILHKFSFTILHNFSFTILHKFPFTILRKVICSHDNAGEFCPSRSAANITSI
jgi:hypothetical protein